MKRLHYFLFYLLIVTTLSHNVPAYCAVNQSSFVEKAKSKATYIKNKIKPYLKPENIIIGLIVTAAVVRLCFYLKNNNNDNPPPAGGSSRFNSRRQTNNRRTIAVDNSRNNAHLQNPNQWTNINTANAGSHPSQSSQTDVELEKECFICFLPTNNQMACCKKPVHSGCLNKWTKAQPANSGICPECQTNKNFRVI